jgi:copper chaperone CopZ
MEIETPTMPAGVRELPLMGGGAADTGCACCAPAGAAPAARVEHEASVTAEFGVAGMTCQNCVSHVTADLTGLDGVRGVEVDLVAGGVSTVRVLSDEPIDAAAIAEVVADGGYELVTA